MGNAESVQPPAQQQQQRPPVRQQQRRPPVQQQQQRRPPVQQQQQRRYPVQQQMHQSQIRVPVQQNSVPVQNVINQNIQQQLNHQRQQLEAQSRHQKRLEDQLKLQEDNNKMFQDYVESQVNTTPQIEYKSTPPQNNQYRENPPTRNNMKNQNNTASSQDYDPYEILGIDSSATLDQIKKAYKKRALQYHPDRGGNAAIFKIIKKSYQDLLNKYNSEHQFEQKINQEVRNQHYDSSMNSGMYNKHIDKDNFNVNKFNKVFDQYRLDDENDNGYGEIMDNITVDNIEVDKTKQYNKSNFNISNFNDNFNSVKKKSTTTKIIEYTEPEALISGDSLAFSELGAGKIDDFSSTQNNMQYTDYKKAHVTETTLIDPNEVQYKQYKNLNDIKRDRDNISYNMSTNDKEQYNMKKNKEDYYEEQRKQRVQNRDNMSYDQFSRINTNMIRQ
jgi:curved DNA-binding protein CbpA